MAIHRTTLALKRGLHKEFPYCSFRVRRKIASYSFHQHDHTFRIRLTSSPLAEHKVNGYISHEQITPFRNSYGKHAADYDKEVDCLRIALMCYARASEETHNARCSIFFDASYKQSAPHEKWRKAMALFLLKN